MLHTGAMLGDKNKLYFEYEVASEAAIRARQYLEKNAGNTIDTGSSRDAIAEQWLQQFLTIYDYIYQDSSQHFKKVGREYFNTTDLATQEPHKLQTMRQAFQQTVDSVYDECGNVAASQPQAVHALKNLYTVLMRARNLHSQDIALGTLYRALGAGSKWAAIAPNGIDFTRCHEHSGLEKRLTDAMNGEGWSAKPSNYIHPPQNFAVIGGHRIMVMGDAFVTQDAYLIPRHEVEQWVAEGHAIENFHADTSSGRYAALHTKLNGTDFNVPGTIGYGIRERLRHMAETHHVDEQPFHNGAPLMSMDIDVLTGLRFLPAERDDATQLQKYLSSKGVADYPDLLPEERPNMWLMEEGQRQAALVSLSETVQRKLDAFATQARAENLFEIADLMERASSNLVHQLPRIAAQVDKEFVKKENDRWVAKQPAADHETPRFYMSMGGMGSGKSKAQKIAVRETGDDLIVGSLDNSRGLSDRLSLYPGTSNHRDDYRSIARLGNAVRSLTQKTAQAGGYHYYNDGTGIPYEGKYDALVESFHARGYETTVLEVTAPLYIDDEDLRTKLEKEGLTINDVMRRSGDRLLYEHRTVPVEYYVTSHIKYPSARLKMWQDDNVDRRLMWDNSGGPGQDFLLSFQTTMDQKQIDDLTSLKGPERKKYLIENRLVPEWLPSLPNDARMLNFKTAKRLGQDCFRVEIITNMVHYLSNTQKGLYNNQPTQGPEDLYHNTLSFDIAGRFNRGHGKLKAERPTNLTLAVWPPVVKVDPSLNQAAPAR